MTEEELSVKRKESNLKSLVDRGLTEDEAKQFIVLLDKLTPTEEDIDGFYHEMEQGIPFEGGMEYLVPFEGGMSFTEALTGLKESC